MARLPRLDLACVAQHVVQRGNNRLPCFLDDCDRRRYLQNLHEALLDTDVKLHACVLMSNHVHLLATPPAVGAIPRLMQKLGRQYVGASMRDIDVPERCGKAATSLVWSKVKATCFVAAAIST
ncbi:transposase [Tahibacter aquaticus]|uniref:transposase n=1 Tax=Tahibacter aquaticus TaxID=520092 RepID=UPI003132BC59